MKSISILLAALAASAVHAQSDVKVRQYTISLVKPSGGIFVGKKTELGLRVVDSKHNPAIGVAHGFLTATFVPSVGPPVNTWTVRIRAGSAAGEYRLTTTFHSPGTFKLFLDGLLPGVQVQHAAFSVDVRPKRS